MAERMFFGYNNRKNSKYKLSEYAVMTRFSSRFETDITVVNQELYDTNVLKGILFVLTSRDGEVNDMAHSILVNDAHRLKIFSTSKVKSLMQDGKFSEASYKIEEIVNKRWSNLLPDTCRLFYKVLICLVEYLDFDAYGEKNIDAALRILSKLFAYCYTLTADNYCLKEYGALTEIEKDEFAKSKGGTSKKDTSWDIMVKNNPLKGSYLGLSKDKERNEDFALIYEAIFKYWYNDLYEVDKELRNNPKCLECLELKSDWSFLLKLLDKNYFKNMTSTSNDFNVAFAPRIKNSMKMKYEEKKTFVEYVYSITVSSIEGLFIGFVRDISNSLASDFYTEFLSKNNQEKSDLASELKDLKSANRNLTKSVTKLGADNDLLKAQIEENKAELEQSRKVELESQELIELRKKS